MEFDFQPLNDYVLLRQVVPDEFSGDMPVSHSAHAQAEWGEVVAVGAGGQVVSPVSKGDRVAFRPASAMAIALHGQWFAMTRASELLGVTCKAKELRPAASITAVPEAEREEWAVPANRAREECLDTDVAPDLLDRSEVTGEDLH